MSQWLKVITSGSAASLVSLTLDTDLGVAHGGTGLSATSASAFLVGTGTTTFTTVGSNGTGRVVRETGAVGVIMSGSFSGSYIGDGSGLTGIPAGVGGPNESIQFNDGGSVSGSANFRFKKSTNVVEISGSVIVGTAASVSGSNNNVTFGSSNRADGLRGFVHGNNHVIRGGINANSAIIAGETNTINASDGGRNLILGGYNNFITGSSDTSVIISSDTSTITGPSYNSVLVAGTGTTINNSAYSFAAGGDNNIINGFGTTTLGYGLIGSASYQTVVGSYNKRGNSTALFIIGSGSGNADAQRQDLAVFAPGSIQLNTGVSGSFSGSFVGNGAGLTGLLADSSFSVLAADNTGTTFNTATDVFRFVSASAHGFGFTISEVSNTASIAITTPQDLRTTATPTFGGLNSTGPITGSTLRLTAAGGGTGNSVAVFGTNDFLVSQSIDARVWGTTLIDGSGSANRLAVWSDTNTAVSDANLTYNGTILTVNGSTFGADVSIAGNLTVLGDTTILNVSNLLVEDRFIIINSGSNTGDGGIIVQSGSAGYGAAFAWDDSIARWGFQQNTLLTHSASTFSPEAYAAAVIDVDGGQSVTSAFTRNGNIRIEGGEIFIYA